MTNRNIQIVVFDDESDLDGRKNFAPLSQIPEYSCSVEFVSLADSDALAKVREIVQGNLKPDIVLMDHVLDKTSEESKKFLEKGVSLVPLLREHWSTCPILAVTAAYEECVNEFGSDIYEEVFDRKDIASLAAILPSIVQGYKQAREIRSYDDLMHTLDVPCSEHEVLHHSLPDVPKNSDEQKRSKFVHLLYRWFRHTLYAISGFLYNEKWVAVTLGISEAHIDSYLSKFDDCRYAGIWAEPDNPRWWKASLYSSVLNKSDNSQGKPIQEVSCEVIGVPEEHYSKCSRCDEKWPEILAYPDEATSDEGLEPMHLRCSEPHPTLNSLPYFEEPRIMLEEGQ